MNGVRSRIGVVGVFVLAAILGALLLHVSQMVQNRSDRLNDIKAQIENEQNTIRVLDAEWAYLNAPERLERLAVEYFGVGAPTADQMLGDEGGAMAASLPFPNPIENTQEQPLVHEASYQNVNAADLSSVKPASGKGDAP